jgi:hypothetical protein
MVHRHRAKTNKAKKKNRKYDKTKEKPKQSKTKLTKHTSRKPNNLKVFGNNKPKSSEEIG